MTRIIIQRNITYLLFFGISLVLVFVSSLFANFNSLGDIFSTIVFTGFSIVSFIVGLRMCECANITEQGVLIRSFLGKINYVEWTEVREAYITDVNLLASRGSISERCIVIQLKPERISFTTVQNKKNSSAIKIKYSKKNFKILSQFLIIEKK